MVHPVPLTNAYRPHHTSGRTAQQTVLGTEMLLPYQSASTSHHMYHAMADRFLHVAQVIPEYRAQVSIYSSSFGTVYVFD